MSFKWNGLSEALEKKEMEEKASPPWNVCLHV